MEPTNAEPTSEQVQPYEPQQRIRKTAPNAELPVWAQNNPTAPGPSVEQMIAEYGEHISVGEWGGVPNYLCNYCDFATIEGVGQAIDHYQWKHAVPVIPVQPSALVGPNGEPLESTLPQGEESAPPTTTPAPEEVR